MAPFLLCMHLQIGGSPTITACTEYQTLKLCEQGLKDWRKHVLIADTRMRIDTLVLGECITAQEFNDAGYTKKDIMR